MTYFEDYYTDLSLDPDDGSGSLDDIIARQEEAWASRYEDHDSMWDVVESAPVRSLSGDMDCSLNNIISSPKAIRDLYQECRKDYWSIDRKKCFSKQAMMMRDYTDSVSRIAHFVRSNPTYTDMSISQMRTYFTLRSQLRSGLHPDMPISYLYVYIYELLMLIGVDTPEEGLFVLDDLLACYGDEDIVLRYELQSWIKDFVIYYGIKDAVSSHFAIDLDSGNRLLALNNYARISDESLFALIVPLSKYKIKEASPFKRYPTEITIGTARAIKAAAPLLEARYGLPFGELCMGSSCSLDYNIFGTANVYFAQKHADTVFEVSPCHKYTCHGGIWKTNIMHLGHSLLRPDGIGNILHEAERCLRPHLKKCIKTFPRLHDPELSRAIGQAVQQYIAERAEASRPKVEIDMSKLGRIREDAAVVRQALLTDDEIRQEEQVEAPVTEARAPLPQPTAADDSAPSLLSAEEKHFVRLLLEGGDWKSYLRQIHTPPGVVTESINDKMMEITGDMVLDDDGSGPCVVEDYIGDLKSMITD